MRKNTKIIFAVIILLAIPVIGYAIMRGTNLLVPLSEGGTGNYFLYTIILIAVGLFIPVAFMKLLFHSAHMKNSHEKELQLKDLPKDKDDAERALKRQ